MIREFVREKRYNRKHVTQRQVMDFLVSEEVLFIPREENGNITSRKIAAALRCVLRNIASLNCQRGRGKCVRIKENHIAWLSRFLHTLAN